MAYLAYVVRKSLAKAGIYLETTEQWCAKAVTARRERFGRCGLKTHVFSYERI